MTFEITVRPGRADARVRRGHLSLSRLMARQVELEIVGDQ